jgi:hypothetical protein
MEWLKGMGITIGNSPLAVLSRRKAVYFFEDPAEIGVILEARVQGDFLDGLVGFEEEASGEKDPEAVEVVPGRKPHLSVKDPGEVILADVDRLREFPAGNVGFDVIVKIKKDLFYQSPGMGRENFVPRQEGLDPFPEFRGRRRGPVADEEAGKLA